MAKKLRVQQLLKIYYKTNRVNRPHNLCLVFPKGGGYPRVMVEFEQYLMPQKTYAYAKSTAKKLRAKLLIPES